MVTDRTIDIIAAPAKDRTRMLEYRHSLLAALALLATLPATLLLASSAPARPAVRHTAAAAATVTIAPSPTAIPTPLPPPPLSVPAGWQVYRGHHFALAYPPGWTTREHTTRTSNGQATAVSIAFDSPDGSRGVAINEEEQLDGGALQQFCSQPGTHTTYAGLPMITARTAYTLRTYVFASRQGVAYTLFYEEIHSTSDAKARDNAILSTFRPEEPTPACP